MYILNEHNFSFLFYIKILFNKNSFFPYHTSQVSTFDRNNECKTQSLNQNLSMFTKCINTLV